MNCQDIIKAKSLYACIRFLFAWVCIENIICYEYYRPLAPQRRQILYLRLFFLTTHSKTVAEILLNSNLSNSFYNSFTTMMYEKSINLQEYAMTKDKTEIFDKQLFFWNDPFKPVTETLLNVQPLYFFVQMLYVQECTKGIVSIYRDTQWLKKIKRLTIVQTNIFVLHAERLNYYSWQIQEARAALGKTTQTYLHFSA